jgi:hypothetical protein
MTSSISYEQRKKLADELKELTKDQYEEVFRIIKRSGATYSENSNGIFFDLNTLPNDSVEVLSRFMELVLSQRVEEKRRLDDLAYYRLVKEEGEGAK